MIKKRMLGLFWTHLKSRRLRCRPRPDRSRGLASFGAKRVVDTMVSRFAILEIVCFLLLIQLATMVATAQPQRPPAKQVTLRTEDGITLYADIYLSPKGKRAPLIMLFHQGDGDARGEYGPLAPRLSEQGYNVIATDLRSGGSLFGSTNRTVDLLRGREFSYCEAYEDLKATLRYIKKEGFRGKHLAWGSSYSAALVIRLGVEYSNDLAGILAFSPASGEPMEHCKPEPYISKLKIPALALRPVAEMERDSVREQFSLFQKFGHQTYVADRGAHGSSMLNPARVKGSVEENWKKVLDFIKQALAKEHHIS